MSDGDAYDVTLKMTRGTSSDDKEVLKTTTDRRLEAGDLREIQPVAHPAGHDDQATLGEGST